MIADPPRAIDARHAIPAEDFRHRVEHVAHEAGDRALDALLVWSRGGSAVDRCGDVLWLTNYYNPWPAVPDSRWWSGQSLAAALVTAKGRCVLITNVPSSEWRDAHVVCDAFTDEPFIHVGAARCIEEAGLASARIGLAGREALSIQVYDLIRSALPDVTFVSADELLADARRVKSESELKLIRETGRVADATMTALLAASQPGTTEREAAAAAVAALVAAGGTPYMLALASGPSADRYAPTTLPTWSDRTFVEGDLWHVDMAGCFGGYLFDFARTTVVGVEPDAEQREMIEAAIGAVDAVIERIEPGRPVREAVGPGRRALAHSGGPPPGKHDYPHLGHTIGLGFEDVWLSEEERRPFEAGWYVAVEAVVARDRRGFAMFEQNVFVAADGVELITRCSPRPWEEM